MITVAASTKLWAFAMAEQFEKHGMLDELITTYSYEKNTLLRRFSNRTDKEKISLGKIRTNIFLALPIGYFRKYSHVWNEYFDRWAARKLQSSKSKVFIGWSGMSLHSIKSAKKKGMLAILERGSSHILVQNEILKTEYGNFGKDFSIHPAVIKKELLEYEAADYITVPSLFVKNSFIQQGIPEVKIFLNPYGANREFVRKIFPEKTDGGPFKIVYLGTLSIRKGLVYFFEALKKIQIPSENHQVIFIGSVDKEMEPTIKKYQKKNWVFTGHVDHYRIPDYLNNCDIGVQPSLEEGLSMVIPQMMACGVPVIVTPNTGGENIIKDNINGFIVPVRDPGAIAGKLDWAFHNKESLNVMKLRASEAINNEFTWDSYGDRYVTFLKSIIK